MALIGRADIILFSGGLGPTEDDLTREAAAAALGRDLHAPTTNSSPTSGSSAASPQRRMSMPPNNLPSQTDVIDGAVHPPQRKRQRPRPVHRSHRPSGFEGTEDREPSSSSSPAHPRSSRPSSPTSRPSASSPRTLPSAPSCPPPPPHGPSSLSPQVDARTSPIYQSVPQRRNHHPRRQRRNPASLRIAAETDTAAEAQAQRRRTHRKAIEQEMGDEHLLLERRLPRGDRPPQPRHAPPHPRRRRKSCSGGLLSQRLTAIPNSSSATSQGGVVVYTDTRDEDLLLPTFPPELVQAPRCRLSPEVARALAEGIRKRAPDPPSASAITGLAGPGGGAPGPDESKPVGLVYIALADTTMAQRSRKLKRPRRPRPRPPGGPPSTPSNSSAGKCSDHAHSSRLGE